MKVVSLLQVKPLIDADFIGKSVLKDQKENGAPRRTVGLELLEKGIARTGYEVMDLDGNIIGEVTSEHSLHHQENQLHLQ